MRLVDSFAKVAATVELAREALCYGRRLRLLYVQQTWRTWYIQNETILGGLVNC
jgi:hypothetical protein